jgi:hypothetical protein
LTTDIKDWSEFLIFEEVPVLGDQFAFIAKAAW